jgi:hypothetical protein
MEAQQEYNIDPKTFDVIVRIDDTSDGEYICINSISIDVMDEQKSTTTTDIMDKSVQVCVDDFEQECINPISTDGMDDFEQKCASAGLLDYHISGVMDNILYKHPVNELSITVTAADGKKETYECKRFENGFKTEISQVQFPTESKNAKRLREVMKSMYTISHTYTAASSSASMELLPTIKEKLSRVMIGALKSTYISDNVLYELAYIHRFKNRDAKTLFLYTDEIYQRLFDVSFIKEYVVRNSSMITVVYATKDRIAIVAKKSNYEQVKASFKSEFPKATRINVCRRFDAANQTHIVIWS